MKNIFKFALASVAVAFAGFGIYQNMPQENTLSDFALENIEALTRDETNPSYGGIKGDCNKSLMVVTECKVPCVCGNIWYPNPRVPKATVMNVSGKCSVCGNTCWLHVNQPL